MTQQRGRGPRLLEPRVVVSTLVPIIILAGFLISGPTLTQSGGTRRLHFNFSKPAANEGEQSSSNTQADAIGKLTCAHLLRVCVALPVRVRPHSPKATCYTRPRWRNKKALLFLL